LHKFEVVSKQAEIDALWPILRDKGFEPPAPGCCVLFVERDEAGEVVAILPLQQAMFAEGVVSLNKTAQIRTLWNLMIRYIKEKSPTDVSGRSLLAIPSTEKVARACEALGCENTHKTVYRRWF
jgi:hypothetical protein